MSPIVSVIHPFLLLGAGVVVFVGLIDDLVDLPPWQKLLGQGVAAALATIGFPPICSLFVGGTTHHLGIAQRVVTFLWTIGLMNAVNLIDGLDGLVVLTIFPPLVVLLVVACAVGNWMGVGLTVAALGSLAGFYPFNRHEGRLLLGDTGAEFLGYLLAVSTVVLLDRGAKGWAIMPAILLVAVPLSDTVFAVFRRLVHGQSIFQRDNRHIHHRLAQRFGIGRALLVLVGGSVLGSVASLFLWRVNP
ncbi:MAG: undecaprenyl/decaprenyl-phosphate alpha-N-acetylglucosaminyl 1-phosphate transferase [Candidatus Hydrogenedentota bacterium]|nr:MAG: undecaprenyl/decaprenyl-phosphate alpha-N-acetylglucosaminyl 1-phosphate transferase [Candidatus Hydrogenedentota bacterium]